MSETPKTMPEIRGLTKDTRGPDDRPYSAASYAAQYGITVEDASDFIEAANGKHGQVLTQIFAHYKLRPDVKEQAMKGE